MAKRKANTQADKTYNARRRYARAARRELDRAEQSSGATAARHRQLAKTYYNSAIATYDDTPKKMSKDLTRLANEFGFDEERVNSYRKSDYVSQSYNLLEGSLNDENVRREQEARALLNDDTIGSRILGGLVDVWKDKATVTDKNGASKIDNKKIIPALLDYFKVENLADMIDKLEESLGTSLYDLKGNLEDIYEYVKIQIQEKVIDNELVA